MIASVDVFFKLLNFAIYIGLVIYLAKRFMISKIKALMFYEKQDLQVLKENHVKLRDVCRIAEEQIEQGKQLFIVLQSKFTIWNQQENQIALQEQKKCEQRQKNIEIANLKKIKYLQHRKCVEMEIPGLLEHASEQLQQKFNQNKELSQQYKIKVLQALEKLQ